MHTFSSAFWGDGVALDEMDSTRYLYNIGQGGIGLSRDYYFDTDAKSIDIRKKYKELVEKFIELLGNPEYQELKVIKGRKLEYVTYEHPLFGLDKVCPVILGNHVTLDAGTGLVHTAPGHGEDDFNVGKVYGLENFCPVDGRGFMKQSLFIKTDITRIEAQHPIKTKIRLLILSEKKSYSIF